MGVPKPHLELVDSGEKRQRNLLHDILFEFDTEGTEFWMSMAAFAHGLFFLFVSRVYLASWGWHSLAEWVPRHGVGVVMIAIGVLGFVGLWQGRLLVRMWVAGARCAAWTFLALATAFGSMNSILWLVYALAAVMCGWVVFRCESDAPRF